MGAKVTVTYETFTTSLAGAVGAVGSLPKLLPSMPKLSAPNFFMFGDDEPAKAPRRSPVKSKNAAPSKNAPAQPGKAAAPRPATDKDTEKHEAPAAAPLIETATSPAAPPAQSERR
jgi:hypothetical protein